MPANYVSDYERLLCGGIWCIVQMEYFYDEADKGCPFVIRKLTPIQMPGLDIELKSRPPERIFRMKNGLI